MVCGGVRGGRLCLGLWIFMEVEKRCRCFELFVDLLDGGCNDSAEWLWSLHVGIGGVEEYVEDGSGEKVSVVVDEVLDDHVGKYGVNFMLGEWAG